MQNLLIVGLGGFVGAIARFSTSHYLYQRLGDRFPAGTLLVNVVGCLLIGAVMAAAIEREALPHGVRLFLAVGLLGSFTTFSTFGYETIELLRREDYRLVLWSVAGNLGLGVSAVWLGRLIAKQAGA